MTLVSSSHVTIQRDDELMFVVLDRGKVNAIDERVVQQLDDALSVVENAEGVRAVVLIGSGKFFSFGFDIPAFMDHSQEAFTRFLETFTTLYTRLYMFPRPVVGALNGHAIAGGCMLALACDRRIMAAGRGKISLNEITFGSSVFAGCVEMLRVIVGQQNAERVLATGALWSPERALELGLVDEVVPPERLREAAAESAREIAGDAVVFQSMREMLRGPIAEKMRSGEAASIREFVEIWYSEATRERLRKIKIRR